MARDIRNSAKVIDNADAVLSSFSRVLTEDRFNTTGSIVFDMLLSNGNGYPIGKVIEIAGPSSCGKSTACMFMAKTFAARGENVLYLDLEDGGNISQFESFGLAPYIADWNDTTQTGTKIGEQGADGFVKRIRVINNAETYEDVCEILDSVLVGQRNKDGSIAKGTEVKTAIYQHVFLDSLKALVPAELIENSGLKTAIGLDARYTDLFLRKYKKAFARVDCTFWIIGQTRTNLSGYVASQQSTGGKALEYFADIRVGMTKGNAIEGTVSIAGGKKGKISMGHYAKVICKEKNRFSLPGIELRVAVLYGQGLSNIMYYVDKLIELGYIVNAGAYKRVNIEGFDSKMLQGMGQVTEWIGENLEKVKALLENAGAFRLVSGLESED